MFKKILIANRGEIACRIIQTARKLNLHTVAVYSTVDANAKHVQWADEAHCIGPAPALESYLNIQKILDVAKKAQVEAIHPGYGFLSENAAFADAVVNSKLIFIGPPASAIRAMGSKAAAKALMSKAGVPLIPGYHEKNQDPAFLKQTAQQIGFPLLIKASHGGGGKGMRVVEHLDEFESKLEACQREAQKSFASSEVILEKYVSDPRHIEVQVFADTHGQAVYLFERDCSIQRRHQKIIEEAPAFNLSEHLRHAMGQAAVQAAQSIGYVGAGTIEFLLDANRQFYFMEMNTRLQVEHPVTEMITGQDLVAWQFEVAAGKPLPLKQSQIRHQGHAIELRIYAEDPRHDFLPATGTILHLETPEESPSVRLDSGIQTGDPIGIHYDPMLAKLIVKGADREAAMVQAEQALEDLHIVGVSHNISFLSAILKDPAFRKGGCTTHFIEQAGRTLYDCMESNLPFALMAASLVYLQDQRDRYQNFEDPHSPWNTACGWRLNRRTPLILHWLYQKDTFSVELQWESTDHVSMEIQGHRERLKNIQITGGKGQFKIEESFKESPVKIENLLKHFFYHPLPRGFFVSIQGFQYVLALEETQYDHSNLHKSGELTAPMPGIIRKVWVKVDTAVQASDPLITLEAMKMEHTITAPEAGRVTALHFQEGDTVAEGAMLLELQAKEE